jgi:EPS-associated MarR family transcriptional regulator
MLTDKDRYSILVRLARDPDASQRSLAQELGVSVGKVNYCIRALLEKGLLKVNSFRKSDNKRAYTYYLTPMGMEEKSRVTVRFLRRKVAEYESLKVEIERLKREAAERPPATRVTYLQNKPVRDSGTVNGIHEPTDY